MMSFGVIFLLFIVYCVIILLDINVLKKQTVFIFEHPLKVGINIRQVDLNVLKIHREMKDITGSESTEEIIERAERINTLEKEIFHSLDVIQKAYLGNPEDITQLKDNINEWDPIREEVIRLRLKGDYQGATAITKGKMAEYVKKIEDKISSMIIAGNKNASHFVIEAKKSYFHSILITIISGLLFLLISFLIAALNIRSIRKPLALLEDGAKQVEKGNLDFQIPIVSNDEFGKLTAAFNHMSESIKKRNEELKERNKENEHLLLSILPAPIAERLKAGEEPIADAFGDVSVLFADIVGFTEFSYEYPPRKLVNILNRLFSMFDEAAHKYRVEKIKTIGDCYMAVCGLLEPREDHADALVNMGLEMIRGLKELNAEMDTKLNLRIGIHSGPVVAGVIGKEKFIYDLWGDTVNIASRMESYGIEGRIHLSAYAYKSLRNPIKVEECPPLEIKGHGVMKSYLVAKSNT